jgi:16S rRNA G1207 methylase RsmC
MKNNKENYWIDSPMEFAKNRIDSRQYILLPEIAKIIQSINATKILDYGCGEGYLSNSIYNKSVSLSLYDISSKMVELAKSNSIDNNIEEVLAYNSVDEIPQKIYDSVVLSLVLMTIGKDAEYKKVLENCKKVLSEDGLLLIGITHPCFRKSMFSTHHTKYTLGTEFDYFANNKPFNVFLRTSQSDKFIQFKDFHHSLSYTFSMLNKVGFYVEDMIELKDKSIENSFYNKKYSPYLILKCKLK